MHLYFPLQLDLVTVFATAIESKLGKILVSGSWSVAVTDLSMFWGRTVWAGKAIRCSELNELL